MCQRDDGVKESQIHQGKDAIIDDVESIEVLRFQVFKHFNLAFAFSLFGQPIDISDQGQGCIHPFFVVQFSHGKHFKLAVVSGIFGVGSAKRVINHVEKFFSPGREEIFVLDKHFLCLFPDDLGIEALTIFMVTNIGEHFS